MFQYFLFVYFQIIFIIYSELYKIQMWLIFRVRLTTWGLPPLGCNFYYDKCINFTYWVYWRAVLKLLSELVMQLEDTCTEIQTKVIMGPCKRGSRDSESNFKQTGDSGFKFQNGSDSGFKFQNFLGFEFQINFLGFTFQNSWDSRFRFGLTGPS